MYAVDPDPDPQHSQEQLYFGCTAIFSFFIIRQTFNLNPWPIDHIKNGTIFQVEMPDYEEYSPKFNDFSSAKKVKVGHKSVASVLEFLSLQVKILLFC